MKQKHKITAISTLLLFILVLTSCNKTTKIVPVDNISLNQTEITLNPNQQLQLTAILSPDNATNKTVIYQTSDENIALVSPEGLIIAQNYGIAKITASAEHGKINATCEITVSPEPIPVTGISLNQTTLAIEVGKTETLIATIEPENATNKNIIWNSSDESIATVSEEGVVTAISEGTAIISATSEDSEYTASCDIVVYIAFPDGYIFSVTNTEEWLYSVNGVKYSGNDKTYTINILNDFMIPVNLNQFTFGSNNDIAVTINGCNINTPTVEGNIRIGRKQTVTINNITLTARIANRHNLIYIGEEAIFIMKGDSCLVEGFTIAVAVNGGVFLMYDGVISGNGSNQGGGVIVSRGIFKMFDGVISNNISFGIIGGSLAWETGKGGGVLVTNNGQFEMYGGKITKNVAFYYGGGVAIDKGSTFVMYGGEISYNFIDYRWGLEGGGLYIEDNSSFIFRGGTIYGSEETGVPSNLANSAPVLAIDWSQNVLIYGDGSNILPHLFDWDNYMTNYTIIGRE